MKKIYITLIAIFIYNFGSSQCVNSDADPSITGASFTSPCVSVGSTNVLDVGWFMLDNNLDFTTTAPAGSWGIQISLPGGGQYSVSSAANVTSPDVFDWEYDASNQTLRGYSNTAVSWGQGGNVLIEVTANSSTSCASITTVANIFRTSTLDPSPLAMPCQNAFADDNANNSAQSAMGTQVTVPVVLASFEVESTDCHEAQLSWTTVAEVNNSHFEVLRSYDGRSFETITLVEGNGTTSDTKEYNYTDRDFKTQGEYVYYSLRQVDYDGSSQRFENKSIKNTCEIGELSLEIFPNPTAEELNLSILDFPSSESQVTVLINGADGQLAKKETINSFGGEAQLNLEELKPGMYLLKLITEFQIMEKRFIKIK